LGGVRFAGNVLNRGRFCRRLVLAVDHGKLGPRYFVTITLFLVAPADQSS
jgi:hypothetical protein